jgi:Ca2+-binding EF-hand superfamily protein
VIHSQGDNPSDFELRELWLSLAQTLPARINSNNKPVSDSYTQLDFNQFCDAMSYSLQQTPPLEAALSMLDPQKTGKIHVCAERGMNENLVERWMIREMENVINKDERNGKNYEVVRISL